MPDIQPFISRADVYSMLALYEGMSACCIENERILIQVEAVLLVCSWMHMESSA